MKRALISGITGQDGSYLADLLIEKGYKVFGLVRRSSSNTSMSRIEHLLKHPNLVLLTGDLGDAASLHSAIQESDPDEIYNLAAQSHVRTSFDVPEYTADITGAGVVRLLEAARKHNPKIRMYQASSSEMFGKVQQIPQTEATPFYPRSPYGVAKLYAHWMCINYRESYNMFICNGILFNHESERRGEEFVTRKITKAIAKIKAGKQDDLVLGNIEAKRDWGHSRDYCINKDVPILTPNGWKFYDEISIGDRVINFNANKNCLQEDIVSKVINTTCNGDKIIFSGRGVYFKCTPNHRIYYQRKSKNSNGGWSAWKVSTAESLYNIFKDKNIRTKYDFRFPHFSNFEKKSKVLKTDDEIYLLGCLLAEGCHFVAKGQGRGSQLSISQSYIANERIHSKISDIIDRLGLKCHIINRNDGVTHWTFSAESRDRILRDLFDSSNIHIMPKYAYDLDQRQAKILFDALMDCDGCWGNMTYTSKRYLLASDFQTIAHLSGRRTSSISKKGECYVVNVIATRKEYSYVQDIHKCNDGVEDVWCISTNNGTIITRDHNSIFISGNCQAMWLMLQQGQPDDYVVATGETHSVREFLEEAFSYAGLDWKDYVKFDKAFTRPAEVDLLIGDSTKARTRLGWKPTTSFKDLVHIMVDHDLKEEGIVR